MCLNFVDLESRPEYLSCSLSPEFLKLYLLSREQICCAYLTLIQKINKKICCAFVFIML